MPEWLFSAITIVGVILFLAPALAILFGGWPDRVGVVFLAIGIPLAMVIALAEWLAFGAPLEFAIFEAAMSSAVIAAILGIGFHRVQHRGLIIFAALWLVLVLVPIAFVTFDAVDGWVFVTLGTLDYGGASQFGLSLGMLALSLALLERLRRRPATQVAQGSTRALVVAGILGLAGWIALTIGAELAVDETTIPVLINTLVGGLAGAIGWSIAEGVRVHRIGLAGLISGMTAGILVTLSTSPWLVPVAAAALAILAGVFGSLTLAGLRRAGLGAWSSVVAICLVPGLFGMLATGLVENVIGFIYAGQPGILINQLAGSGLILAYTLVVTVVLAMLIDRTVGFFRGEASEVSTRPT